MPKNKSRKNFGFTLIELLVVISVIGFLATAAMMVFNNTRTKAKDVAALATGISLAKAIESCDMDSGKVTIPNSTTNPNNNICTLGAGYGIWPKVPEGWLWYQYVWINGENNLIYLTSTYSGSLMHCGHYPDWSTYYCPPNGGQAHVGLCRLVLGFGCTVYDPATGIWK